MQLNLINCIVKFEKSRSLHFFIFHEMKLIFEWCRQRVGFPNPEISFKLQLRISNFAFSILD